MPEDLAVEDVEYGGVGGREGGWGGRHRAGHGIAAQLLAPLTVHHLRQVQIQLRQVQLRVYDSYSYYRYSYDRYMYSYGRYIYSYMYINLVQLHIHML